MEVVGYENRVSLCTGWFMIHSLGLSNIDLCYKGIVLNVCFLTNVSSVLISGQDPDISADISRR